MTSIGIIGAGVAGLQLGLYLRQHGIDVTIYAEKSPEQQFGSRLPALVARSGNTRERERSLGVNHWDGSKSEFERVHVHVSGEQPMDFVGQMERPFIAVDMRIYFGRLQEDFIARGGHVVIGEVQASDLDRIGAAHDLLVVATGRGGLSQLFPRRDDRSPFSAPQRWIATGIFHGITAAPATASMTFVPEHGEIFEFPIYSFEPNLVGLGLEAIPGGVLEPVARMSYSDDPAAFNAALLELLREHAPQIYARIDPQAFGLTRPLDLMQGGVTPTARQGYTRLASGTYALAIGDVFIVNDPITGQGANTASYSALLVGEAIRESAALDEAFCQEVERRLWAYAGPVADWTNAMLMPPPPHVIEFLAAAAQHQSIADLFAGFFERPQYAWEVLSNPDATSELLAQHGWQGMPEPVAA